MCGAVRYRLDAEPFDAGYCHCLLCRRSAGAPVLAFATVPIQAFVLTEGEPRRRASSEIGERWFCGDCGTQLAMRVTDEPDPVDFTLGSLDEPEAVAPGFHIWTARRIGWFETADDFPRFHRSRTPQEREALQRQAQP